MRRPLLTVALLLTITPPAVAQPGVLTKQQLIEYTPDWKGERFPDGRPKVPDAILDRMKNRDPRGSLGGGHRRRLLASVR